MDIKQLDRVAAEVKDGKNPEYPVRALLSWFDAERRGSSIVAEVRKALRQRQIRTDPDFNDVWIDVTVRFVPDVTPSSSPPSKRPDDSKTATLQQAPVAKAADAGLCQ